MDKNKKKILQRFLTFNFIVNGAVIVVILVFLLNLHRNMQKSVLMPGDQVGNLVKHIPEFACADALFNIYEKGEEVISQKQDPIR